MCVWFHTLLICTYMAAYSLSDWIWLPRCWIFGCCALFRRSDLIFFSSSLFFIKHTYWNSFSPQRLYVCVFAVCIHFWSILQCTGNWVFQIVEKKWKLGANLNKNSKRAAGVIVLCASSMQIESVTAGFKFYIERIWFQLISWRL